MKETFFLKAADGVRIHVAKSVSDEDRAVLVMAHGLGEHAGTFAYMAAKLNDAGIGTYQPDHRGHGRSDGERGHLDDFNQLADDFHMTVTKALEENHKKPVFLYGHSMGGLTAALHSVKYPDLPIAGVITSGAVVVENQNLFGSFPKGLDVHTVFPNELYEEICSVTERVDEFRADPYATLLNTAGTAYEILRADEWLSPKMKDFSYPLFLTHGAGDVIVSPKDSMDFFEKAGSPDKQLKLYGGAHHGLFNEFCRDEFIDDCIGWINRRS